MMMAQKYLLSGDMAIGIIAKLVWHYCHIAICPTLGDTFAQYRS
jgi:hypothetical protein